MLEKDNEDLVVNDEDTSINLRSFLYIYAHVKLLYIFIYCLNIF